VDIYFQQNPYNVTQDGDGCETLWVWINITAPLEYFFAAQFLLEWDCNLLELRTAGTQNSGKGNIYNGSGNSTTGWHLANQNAVNLVGLNPQCPEQGTYPAPNAQGRAAFLAAWDTYPDTHNGQGINVTAPMSGPPAEGILSGVRFRTTGPTCYGTTINTGSLNLNFLPTLKIVGYLDGDYDYYATRNVTWANTSVNVQ
jgi:hypothetical protein